MSDLRVGNGLFFEKGIDSITFKGSEQAQGLPDLFELPPSGNVQPQMLARMLALPNIESYLDDCAQPELDDRELLLPGPFAEVLDRTRETLRRKSQEWQGADPEAARDLVRAERVLNDEHGLRDLLRMYRSSLFRG